MSPDLYKKIDLHSYRGLIEQRTWEKYILAADYTYSAWKIFYLNRNATVEML